MSTQSQLTIITACTVLLISLKAGGLGLQLVAANVVFLMDPWWNPSVEHQAIDRCHRIGQRKEVHVYRLTMKVPPYLLIRVLKCVQGSVEEPLLKLQQGKMYLNQGLRMSRDELKEYKLDELKKMFEQPSLHLSKLKQKRNELLMEEEELEYTRQHKKQKVKQEDDNDEEEGSGRSTMQNLWERLNMLYGDEEEEDSQPEEEEQPEEDEQSEEDPFMLDDKETLIEELTLPEDTEDYFVEEEEPVELDDDEAEYNSLSEEDDPSSDSFPEESEVETNDSDSDKSVNNDSEGEESNNNNNQVKEKPTFRKILQRKRSRAQNK